MMTDREVIVWLHTLPGYTAWEKAIGGYDPSYDYSGPENSVFLRWLIPSRLWGINCNPAFYAHDGAYSVGGGSTERELADDNMQIIGLKIIKETKDKKYLYGFNGARRFLARRRLQKYYYAVRVGGSSSFNYDESATNAELTRL
jgi:hypothetical protein